MERWREGALREGARGEGGRERGRCGKGRRSGSDQRVGEREREGLTSDSRGAPSRLSRPAAGTARAPWNSMMPLRPDTRSRWLRRPSAPRHILSTSHTLPFHASRACLPGVTNSNNNSSSMLMTNKQQNTNSMDINTGNSNSESSASERELTWRHAKSGST
eukprot:259425-Rhodomonas_salina.3